MNRPYENCFVTLIALGIFITGYSNKETEFEKVLFEGIHENDTAMISIAAQSGASLNTFRAEGRLPLFVALKLDHYESFQHLLRGGADPDLNVAEGGFPLAYHLLSPSNRRYLQGAIDFGLDVNIEIAGAGGIDLFTGEKRTFPLITIAARRGHVDIVHDLIRAGADPMARDSEGRSLFQNSVERGALQLAYFLLRREFVDLDAESEMDWWKEEFQWQEVDEHPRKRYWFRKLQDELAASGTAISFEGNPSDD